MTYTRQRTIGGRATQFPDVETARKVSVDYTLAAAKAFSGLASKLPEVSEFDRYSKWT